MFVEHGVTCWEQLDYLHLPTSLLMPLLLLTEITLALGLPCASIAAATTLIFPTWGINRVYSIPFYSILSYTASFLACDVDWCLWVSLGFIAAVAELTDALRPTTRRQRTRLTCPRCGVVYTCQDAHRTRIIIYLYSRGGTPYKRSRPF